MKGKILTDNIIGYKKCKRMDGMSMSGYHNYIRSQSLPLFPTMSKSNYTYIPHSAFSKQDEVIVTLEIPRGAIVFSINGYKCRTNKAKMFSLQ